MAPSNPYNAVYLQQFIYYSLDNNILPNALFLAQRLHAYEPTPDASYLLSLCYLRLNQLSLAAECSGALVKTSQHLGCAYIFAQCCKGLERYRDGITALEPWKCLKTNHWNNHSKTLRNTSPDAAAVLLLLGQLYEGHQDTRKAAELYAQASKLNPFIWDTFTSLCNIGVKIQVQNIFEPTKEMIVSLSEPRPVHVDPFSSEQPLNITSQTQPAARTSPTNDPFHTSSRHNIQSSFGDFGIFGKSKGSYSGGLSLHGQTIGEGLTSKLIETANKPYVAQDLNPFSSRDTWGTGAPDSIFETALVPPKQRFPSSLEGVATHQQKPLITRRPTRDSQVGEENIRSDEFSQNARTATIPVERKRTSSGKAVQRKQVSESTTTAMATRRSTRLRDQLHTEAKTSLAATGAGIKERRELKQPKLTALKRPGTTTSLTQEASRTPKNSEFTNQNINHSSLIETVPKLAKVDSSSEGRRRKEGLFWLSDLLKPLGRGYYYLAQFQIQAALDIFYSIPTAQRETSWVLSQIGRAYFEKAAFKDAAKTFAKLRIIDPANMGNMDIYSTALWHLKREVDLAFLSYELIDLERLSPEAWCAVGNSFSLQKDHYNAVKCFKRATQLNPKFAYAFSLEGHEHISNEEYDKAIHAYRSGVAVQRRHYNSWYGLGRVHQKLGKYDLAENYYRIALKINPENAVLIGCIGLILEQKGQLDSAMKFYNKACLISPDTIFVRERRAGIFLKKQDISSSLIELNILKELAPSRADIHILLGRCYSMNGEKNLALQSFTVARALDPLASSMIKEQVEALEQDDDDDRDMA